MKIGDVCWIDFPHKGGREQAGRRPAIAYQAEEFTRKLPTVLVIPLTSQLDALRFPGTVLVEADAINGLARSSVALVFQLTAVDCRSIGTISGRVPEGILNELFHQLNGLMGRHPK